MHKVSGLKWPLSRSSRNKASPKSTTRWEKRCKCLTLETKIDRHPKAWIWKEFWIIGSQTELSVLGLGCLCVCVCVIPWNRPALTDRDAGKTANLIRGKQGLQWPRTGGHVLFSSLPPPPIQHVCSFRIWNSNISLNKREKRARGVGTAGEMLNPWARMKAQEKAQPKVDRDCSQIDARGSHITSFFSCQPGGKFYSANRWWVKDQSIQSDQGAGYILLYLMINKSNLSI